MGERIESYRDLKVYQAAFALQQEIFDCSKQFPPEERFSLVDQIRRSSRSIGANLAEAWQKRAYPPHFVSKLSDADGELAETQHWIETAQSCSYLSEVDAGELLAQAQTIGRMLGRMMAAPDQWCPKQAP